MHKKHVLFICLAASIFLHVLLFTGFSFYLKSSNTPSMLSWPAILAEADLLVSNKPVEFGPAIRFTRTKNMDKSFFVSGLEKPSGKALTLGTPPVEIAQKSAEETVINAPNFEGTNCIYLWEKPSSLVAWDKETIPYKAFISPYGKIILSFPTKLPINSSGNISSQDYLRQAVLFLKNKFLWTKIEGVVR